MYKGTIILLNRRLKSILGIIPSFEKTEFDLSPGNVLINDPKHWIFTCFRVFQHDILSRLYRGVPFADFHFLRLMKPFHRLETMSTPNAIANCTSIQYLTP
jgi:hypothetical protein